MLIGAPGAPRFNGTLIVTNADAKREHLERLVTDPVGFTVDHTFNAKEMPFVSADTASNTLLTEIPLEGENEQKALTLCKQKNLRYAYDPKASLDETTRTKLLEALWEKASPFFSAFQVLRKPLTREQDGELQLRPPKNYMARTCQDFLCLGAMPEQTEILSGISDHLMQKGYAHAFTPAIPEPAEPATVDYTSAPPK